LRRSIPNIRNVTWAKKGKMMHLAKIAFEKFFIRNMKTGNSEPAYRVDEIARILGGSTITDKTKTVAEEMIKLSV
jgi:sulfide:quinone oxidoreductase